MLFLAALWVIEPVYARYAVDEMLKLADGEPVNIPFIVGWWLGIYLMINLAQSAGFFIRWTLINQLLAESRQMYYERMLELDISHHVKARSGELMKKIDNAADALTDLTSDLLIELPTALLTAIAFYIISFFINWKLACIALAMVPLYLVIVIVSSRWTQKHYDKVNNLWVKSLGRGYDALTNIFSVKSMASEGEEVERMRQIHITGIRELHKVNIIWAILEGIGYFMLMRILLISAGIYLLAQGSITLGSLFFFQFSFFRLIVPLEMLQHMLPRLGDKLGKIRMAEEIYHQEIYVQNTENPLRPSLLKGKIEFKDVSFSYGNSDALKNISLTINAGEHVALVGHSGAGKSTTAMLLNRFYDVTGGAILIDDTDIRELDVHWWRNHVGLVLQENIMFNDSLLDNIRYGRPSATKEEVLEAAKRASAHEFISKFPDSYETLIGERGIRLSGGERQRVAIARAILKQPSIVILDEATSALDSKTEKAVQEGIAELIKGKTAVIIAHRLSTVRSVDRIAVLDKGKVIAFDSHDHLLHTCPIYREMVELQSQGMLAEEHPTLEPVKE